MFGTIGIVVVIAAIIVLFSDELRSGLQKLLNNKWLQLFVPQFLLAFLTITYESEISSFLISRQILILSETYAASNFLFFNINIQILQILYLMLVGMLPLLLAIILKKISFIKIDCEKICFWLSVCLWTIAAILVININSGT